MLRTLLILSKYWVLKNDFAFLFFAISSAIMVNVLRSYQMFSECEMTIVYSKHRISARAILLSVICIFWKKRETIYSDHPLPHYLSMRSPLGIHSERLDSVQLVSGKKQANRYMILLRMYPRMQSNLSLTFKTFPGIPLTKMSAIPYTCNMMDLESVLGRY